jgi:hypothetical protein
MTTATNDNHAHLYREADEASRALNPLIDKEINWEGGRRIPFVQQTC